jgi:phage/plasmid-like protein (TIGR03299 family)
MAHNLAVHDGNHVYIGKEAGWHGLGTVTGKFMTWEEIRTFPGLDFDVFKQQLYSPFDGKPLPIYVLVKDQPDDQGNTVIFDQPVKKTFEVISHHRLGEIMDPLIGAKDGAHYVTAGALGNGETVFAAADLGLCVRVGDDIQKPYLMGLCRYGVGANDWRTVTPRPVCQNTVNLAMSESTKQKLRIVHRTGANRKMDDVRDALWSLEGEAKSLEEKFIFLVSKAIPNVKTIMSYLDRLFPLEEGKESTKGRNDKLIAVLERFEKNDGNVYPYQARSAYSLLQSVTGALDHDVERISPESAMFGSANRLKEQALEYALALAEELPANEAWSMRTSAYSIAKPASIDDIINTPSK